MEMQDIARKALQIHQLPKQGSVLLAYIVQLHSDLYQYAETHERPEHLKNVTSTDWADRHPVFKYAFQCMHNVICPKRDCDYYQLENCVKDLVNLGG